jgi:hypothetical protein
MIVYKNINSNTSDIILEIYTNSNVFYKYFDHIEININISNLNNIINLRTITFEEIIENESKNCFIEIKDFDNNLKFIRYNLNLKTYLGNSIYIPKDIFDNQKNIFNYNVGVKILNDCKINIYYNHYFLDIKSINFSLIPYNCFQFNKINSIFLVGESNLYKVYYKKNNTIVNYIFNLINISQPNITKININNIKKMIGNIDNLVKIESTNLIFFDINTENTKHNINIQNINNVENIIDANYINV